MRTANINVQAVLAQAQAKLAGTTQQTSSGDKASETEQIGKISPVLGEVHERIAAQVQTATASLSALGSYKSGLFDLGTAAKALSSLSASSTPASVQSALEKLVTAYNATLKSSAAADSAGAGTGRAQRELDNAIDSLDSPRGSLAKLGIGRQADGTLALDTGALAKAVSADAAKVVGALAGMADGISGTASRTLAEDGRLNDSLARLVNRTLSLKDQEAAVVSAADKLSQLGSAGSSWTAMALAAYRNAS